MSDAFEKWINSFSDEEYEEMLDDSNPNGFSDAQQTKALNIRQAPTKEELEDLTLEQEFREEPLEVEEEQEEIEEPRARPTLPKISRFRQAKGADIIVEPIKPLGGGAPIRLEPTIGLEGMKMTRPPIPIPRVIPPKPPTFTSQVKGAFLGAGKFIRRFFRV